MALQEGEFGGRSIGLECAAASWRRLDGPTRLGEVSAAFASVDGEPDIQDAA